MEKEQREEFGIERIIPVNILEDSKQMRVTIPKEIVEDFKIDPKREKFAWIVQKEKNSNKVTVLGKFVIVPNAKKEN